MSYVLYPPTDVRNSERVDSEETVSLGAVGQAKRVVLYDANGNAITPVSAAASIVDGTTTVTTAGTAAQITAVSTPCKWVMIGADLGNSGNPEMAVGNSTVVAAYSSQRGIILIPGNEPTKIEVSNLNLLWVDARTNGNKVFWFYGV